MKINELLLLGIEKLNTKKIQDANLKTRIILSNILNVTKEYILIHDNEEVGEDKVEEFKFKLARIKNNEPIQYIINNQEFFGMDFYVDENVLIPQPDTEILVEECINISKDVENNPQEQTKNIKKSIKILDLCTGSGIIGVSLFKNVKNAEVYASDISEKALQIAKKNAKKNNAEIIFIKSDLFENIKDFVEECDQKIKMDCYKYNEKTDKNDLINEKKNKRIKFDIIVSNPPYIETETIKKLSEEVQKEPVIALDGGIDGLDFYRKIIKEAKEFLNINGYLALEIGYNQKNAVEKLFRENGYKNIYSKKDLSGNDRIVVAQV